MTDQQTPAFVLDESRYEGHTPGPWRVERGRDGSEVHTDDLTVCCLCDEGEYSDPVGPIDARLIADAPKILAEALRLRAEHERRNDFSGCDGCSTGDCPHDSVQECADAMSTIICEQAAENERLRRALQGLFGQTTADAVHPEDEEDYEEAVAIARDVLCETRALADTALSDTPGDGSGDE